MSLVMQSLARPSSGISKDHLLQALITTRKQEMIERKCAFYDELNSILYGDDNTEPLAVCSNRKGLVKRNQPEKSGETVRKLEESSESTASEEQEEENNIKKKKPRNKPPSERSELVSLLKEFVDRKEETAETARNAR